MTTHSDFGLSKESDWTEPDAIVALFKYKQTLMWETAQESVRRKEMIPVDTILDRITKELDLTEEMYRAFTYAGMMIEYDRKMRSMTAEEREAHDRDMESFLDMLDDAMKDQFGGLDGFIEQAIEDSEQRKSEIEMLDSLFNDEE